MFEMKKIEDLEFTDDYMFGAIMHEKEICKKVLERLLKIQIDDIQYPQLQKSIKPFYEQKGVRMDVYVKGSDKVYDIEIQSSPKSDLGRRTRYYQSMIDVDLLLKGHHYNELNETFILFVCKFDPFGQKFPVYTFENTCIQDTSLKLNDNTRKVFYNGSNYRTETDRDLQAFLNFVFNNEANDDFTSQLKSLVEAKKQDEIFRSNYLAMNIREFDIREEGKREGILEGKREGILEANRQTAKLMLAKKVPVKEISEYTGLTEQEIRELTAE